MQENPAVSKIFKSFNTAASFIVVLHHCKKLKNLSIINFIDGAINIEQAFYVMQEDSLQIVALFVIKGNWGSRMLTVTMDVACMYKKRTKERDKVRGQSNLTTTFYNARVNSSLARFSI
uniref:Uncharacterized protein n=1 Tax=Glossina pallidipes TaxID=7398 RepID=A0A1A9ZH64_GLOPL